MKLLAFIKSPLGNVAILACFAAAGGVLIHRSNGREQARSAQLTRVESAEARPLRESILRVGQPLKVPSRATLAAADATPAIAGDVVDGARSRSARDGRTD